MTMIAHPDVPASTVTAGPPRRAGSVIVRTASRFIGSGFGICVMLSMALLAGGSLTTLALAAARRLMHGEPLDVASLPMMPFDDFAAATVMLVGAVLVVEVAVCGWKGATLSHLLDHGHTATRGDMIWFVLELSGIERALTLIASAGSIAIAQGFTGGQGGFGIGADWPLWIAIPVFLVVAEFCQYWSHRALHSRLLWPFHGMHHGATELTPLGASRTHPVERMFTIWTSSVLPMFVLGVVPETIVWIMIIVTVGNAMSHSNLTFPHWLERYVIVGPRQHHIHHSALVEHRNTNFCAVTPLYDHLFGTWHWEDHVPPTGVPDEDYDSGNPFKDLISCYRIWAAHLPWRIHLR